MALTEPTYLARQQFESARRLQFKPRFRGVFFRLRLAAFRALELNERAERDDRDADANAHEHVAQVVAEGRTRNNGASNAENAGASVKIGMIELPLSTFAR